MKKIMAFVLSVFLIINSFAPVFADPENSDNSNAGESENTETQEQNVKEEFVSEFTDKDLPDRYVVMDLETGAVLFSKGEHEKIKPKSIVGILTFLIMIDKMSLQDRFTTSMNFQTPEGISIAVDVGEEFSVEELLYAILLMDANDAAKALALSLSDSLDEFSVVMNDEAKKLSMNDSNFTTPLDRDAENHYTSLFDIALMTKKAMNYESFRTMVNSANYVIPPTNRKDVARNYINQNNLFVLNSEYYDEKVSGVRVDIDNGSYLMDTTCNFESMSLIFVSEGEGDEGVAYTKHSNLMKKAETEYKNYTLIFKGDVLGKNKVLLSPEEEIEINMISSKNVSVILPKNIDIETSIIKEVKNADLTNVVVEKGTVLGTASVIFQGKEIASVDLVSEGDLSDSQFLGEISEFEEEKTPTQKFLYGLGIAVKIVIIIIIWTFVVSRRRQRLKKSEVSNNVSSIDEYKNRNKF